MKNIFFAAAAISCLVGSAALAEPADDVVPAASAATASTAAPAKSDARRYCITETPTGSRMPRKQCQTRQEWANEGVDIAAASK